MTEQKEFESLDDLFRKTFDNLPEKPGSSGWDTPSELVWQHVQKQIKPPKSGWSTQTLTLVAAFAVTLTVGLYFLLNRPVQPAMPAPEPPTVAVETAKQPSVDVQEQMTATSSTASEAPVAPVKTSKKKAAETKSEKSFNHSQQEAAKPQQQDSVTEKPVNAKRKAPNTTLRLKAELAKQAAEAWKEPLNPLPQRWPGKSNN